MPRSNTNRSNSKSSPHPPQKKESLFLNYQSQRRMEILKKQPKLTSNQLTQLIAAEWTKLSSPERQRFASVKNQPVNNLKQEEQDKRSKGSIKNKFSSRTMSRHFMSQNPSIKSSIKERVLSKKKIKYEQEYNDEIKPIKQEELRGRKSLAKIDIKQEDEGRANASLLKQSLKINQEFKEKTEPLPHISIKKEQNPPKSISKMNFYEKKETGRRSAQNLKDESKMQIEKKSTSIAQLKNDKKQVEKKLEKSTDSAKPSLRQSRTIQRVERIIETQKTEKSLSSRKKVIEADKQPSDYVRFYKNIFSQLKDRFPKRSSKVLTKAVSLEWKKYKIIRKKKIQAASSTSRKKVSVENKTKSAKTKSFFYEGLQIELPKQPVSPYCRFTFEARSQVQKEHPEFSAEEISRELGLMWRQLTDQEKEPFFNEYEQKKRVYAEDLQEIKQKYGYDPRQQSNRQRKEIDLDNPKQQQKKRVQKEKRLWEQVEEKTKKIVKPNPLFQMLSNIVPHNYQIQ